MCFHLSDTDAVWSTCTKAQNSSHERLLNHADAGMHLLWTCVRSFAHPLWPSKRVVSEVTAMFLGVSGHGPSYLTALIQPVASIHLHKTRTASSGGIHLPQVDRDAEEGIGTQRSSQVECPSTKHESRQSHCYPIAPTLYD